MTGTPGRANHVAILAPVGRDAQLLLALLADAAIEASACVDVTELCQALSADLGAVVVTEEAIGAQENLHALESALALQPPWSDLPVLVLTATGVDSTTAARALETLGNVTLLERPLRVGALVSSVRVALRARRRQYQIRAHMQERAAGEEALRDADRRKDEFLATLAHELRNPLAPITNAVEILNRLPGDSSLQWARAVIQRQSRHLARLVEDLLDVSRITRGKIELRPVRVPIASIVASAIETSQPLIAERQHEFDVRLPPDVLFVDADPLRLAQVIGNLLNNAAKYTPHRGRISLSVSREDADVCIRIKDSGIGIDREMLPRIFDMFVQADNRRERATSGLGVGLTLVRQFVEMHGGSVRAESEGANRGSEFVVRLPLAAEAETVALPMPAPVTTGTRRLRILVVDDNLDSANSMGRMLEGLGNHVTVVNGGAKALASLADSPADVALLDIGMPGMNGHELAERIRREPFGHDVVLIAVTGWGGDDDRYRSKAAGFDHHLVKPIDLADLERLLATVVPARVAEVAAALPL